MDTARVDAISDLAETPRTGRALSIIAPAALSAAYPWLLNADLFFARATGLAPGPTTAFAATLAIAMAAAIVATSILICRDAPDPWTRAICALAATTPTLYVGTMNYTYLFDVFP